MLRSGEIYTVDRFEGDYAVLIDSLGGRQEVLKSLVTAEEGAKLRYTEGGFEELPNDGEREEIKSKMNRLFKRR